MNNAYEPAAERDDLDDEPEDTSPPEFWEGATGKWWISYDPPPIPTRSMDWHFRHDGFDGAPDAFDYRAGHAASWGECVDQIRELEADEDDRQRYEHEMGAGK